MKQFYQHPAYYNGELAYVQVPRLIFDHPFEEMSNEARILYGMLLDRMEISYHDPEHWSDNGNAFVYFHVEEVQQTFGVAEEKASKVFKELETTNLIQRKRQGFGRPARIYVNEYWQDPPADISATPYQKEHKSPFNGPKRRMIGFINVPWALFYEPYKNLSNGARILYGLLKKKMDMEKMAGMLKKDSEGTYIYYSVDGIMQTLHIFKEKATKLLKELEGAKLIQRKRQGFGRPAKIRIILPVAAPAMRPHTPENRTSHTPENRTSHTPENRTSRPPENRTSTYNNYSLRNYSINQSTSNESASKAYTVPVDDTRPTRATKEAIAEQVDKERLYRVCPQYTTYTDSVIELIYDEVTSDAPRGRIGHATRTRADIRARLCSLSSEDVQGVIERMNSLNQWPRNPRAYMLTSLYNAATTNGKKAKKEDSVGKYVRQLKEQRAKRKAMEEAESCKKQEG